MTGLKSHDNHILMQQLLPIALRGSLPGNVVRPLVEMGTFIWGICSTTLTLDDLYRLQSEVVSNGKCKSNVHREVVNKKATRISLDIVNGPPLDTVIGPSPELVKKESSQPKYIEIKYKDYLGLHQSNKLYGKASLDRIRISNDVM
ncbi:2-oxoglutarate-dependent dioxygenase 19-like [Corylus avellana]|uniref:2-oxoglutarate-dependent dioxygenase 19-like n=1 Tax=Corylus avellana TaxID=13451 RepID=UPI00286A3C46|nr:2-oxoglutarate-dependent dioxygenase 19-like [Corylus avellana]